MDNKQINKMSYLYLQNFWHYLLQIQEEILHLFSYTDLSSLNTPLDRLYPKYPIGMFHHLIQRKENITISHIFIN